MFYLCTTSKYHIQSLELLEILKINASYISSTDYTHLFFQVKEGEAADISYNYWREPEELYI
jgi:hypothetical protein